MRHVRPSSRQHLRYRRFGQLERLRWERIEYLRQIMREGGYELPEVLWVVSMYLQRLARPTSR